MRFDELEGVIKKVIECDEIKKEGLTMVYQLPEERHKKLDEHLFFKFNPTAKTEEFKHRDTFEIDTGLFTVMFIQEGDKIKTK